MYDTIDKENCYKGEPAVNLLYSPGATNLINGAGDIYARCTKTDLGNGKYRFVNNGTGVTTVRVYTNQPDLINGATYACSVYFENLIGSISIDWCDTGITGVNSSTDPSGRLGGYGSRGSYANPYYFLDINLDSGGAATIFNPQVELNTHVTPFVAGTRSSTQGLLDLTNATTIDIGQVSFDANAQMTFDGTNDYVDLNNFPAFGTGPFTIELICKYDSYINGGCGPNAAFLTNWDSVGTRHVGIWAEYANLGFTLYYQNGFAIFGSMSSLSGKWLHLTAVRNGDTLYAYLNGALINVSTNNSNASIDVSSDAVLGYALCGVGTPTFNGSIPVCKAYNRALTQTEITQNYNSYKSRFNLA